METFQFTDTEKLQLFNAIQQAVTKRNIDEASWQLQAAEAASKAATEAKIEQRQQAWEWFDKMDREEQTDVLVEAARNYTYDEHEYD